MAPFHESCSSEVSEPDPTTPAGTKTADRRVEQNEIEERPVIPSARVAPKGVCAGSHTPLIPTP